MFFTRLWQRHRKLFFIFFLFLLPFIPVFVSDLRVPKFRIYDFVSSYVVHPTAEFFSNTFSGTGLIWSRYIALVKTERQNEDLKKQVSGLEKNILDLQEKVREKERLISLGSLEDFPNEMTLPARIIGEDTSLESVGFFINIGKNQGVAPRMPVVTQQGVVGTIVKVFPRSSLFISILDADHDVDGIVTRSRARAIVEGRSNSLLAKLKYLDRAEDLKVGDDVVTSGLDGIFPKGLLIGSVVKVSRPQVGVLQEASIRSAVDIGKLEEVLVLAQSKSAPEGGELPAAVGDSALPGPVPAKESQR